MCTHAFVSNSAKEATRKSRSSRRRRHNHNAEIGELASFLSSSAQPRSATGSSLVATSGSGSKPPAMAVLRLTLNFLKLQDFVKDSELSQNYIILLV